MDKEAKELFKEIDVLKLKIKRIDNIALITGWVAVCASISFWVTVIIF